MFQGCNGRVCDAGSLQSSSCLLPSFVCRLGCLLNMQLRRCVLVAVECAERSGSSCLDDLRETRLQDVLRKKARPDCVSDRTWMRGLAAMSRALLNPIPDWPALGVACVVLSSVRPGKSRSRDRCPISS